MFALEEAGDESFSLAENEEVNEAFIVFAIVFAPQCWSGSATI